jgi:hypothetical protein
LGSQPYAAVVHLLLQDFLGVQVLHGPVLDLELLNSSMSSQDPFQMFPFMAHSSSSKASMRRREASTGAGSKSSSRRHGSRKRTQQQQLQVLPSKPEEDEELLMRMANSIQQANNLQRSADILYRNAVDDAAWLLVSQKSACGV